MLIHIKPTKRVKKGFQQESTINQFIKVLRPFLFGVNGTIYKIWRKCSATVVYPYQSFQSNWTHFIKPPAHTWYQNHIIRFMQLDYFNSSLKDGIINSSLKHYLQTKLYVRLFHLMSKKEWGNEPKRTIKLRVYWPIMQHMMRLAHQ